VAAASKKKGKQPASDYRIEPERLSFDGPFAFLALLHEAERKGGASGPKLTWSFAIKSAASGDEVAAVRVSWTAKRRGALSPLDIDFASLRGPERILQ
jgi:hypothetical protein